MVWTGAPSTLRRTLATRAGKRALCLLKAGVLDRRSMRSFVLPIQGNEGTRFIAGRSAASPSIATWQKIRFGWDGIENVFDRWDLTRIRLRDHWVPHGEGQAGRSRP